MVGWWCAGSWLARTSPISVLCWPPGGCWHCPVVGRRHAGSSLPPSLFLFIPLYATSCALAPIRTPGKPTLSPAAPSSCCHREGPHFALRLWGAGALIRGLLLDSPCERRLGVNNGLLATYRKSEGTHKEAMRDIGVFNLQPVSRFLPGMEHTSLRLPRRRRWIHNRSQNWG